MKRRALLVGVGATLAAGYLASREDGVTVPEGVVDDSYDRLAPDHPRYEDAPGPDERPEVRADPAASRLPVLGSMWAGSSSCDTSTLSALSLDDDDLAVEFESSLPSALDCPSRRERPTASTATD